jgi:hypothetical protein
MGRQVDDQPKSNWPPAVTVLNATPGSFTNAPDRPEAAASRGLLPTLSLPKGGGAIRGIGEKLTVNPVAGTGAMTVPVGVTTGRSGFGPQLCAYL